MKSIPYNFQFFQVLTRVLLWQRIFYCKLRLLGFSSFRIQFSSCPAEGILDKKEGKFAMTEIVLRPVVTISNEEDREKAEKIMIKAERACLISNSITSEIHLETEVLIAENQNT